MRLYKGTLTEHFLRLKITSLNLKNLKWIFTLYFMKLDPEQQIRKSLFIIFKTSIQWFEKNLIFLPGWILVVKVVAQIAVDFAVGGYN